MATDVSIDFTWTEQDYTDYHKIYRDTTSPVSQTSENKLGETDLSPYTDSNIPSDDTTYYYAIVGVRVETEGEYESDPTEESIYVPSQGPPVPTGVNVTDSQTQNELTIGWDESSEAVGYRVYRAESSGTAMSDYTEIADVSASPYSDTNLEDGEKFYYRVSGYN